MALNKNQNETVLIKKKIIVLLATAIFIVYSSTVAVLVFGHTGIRTNQFETVSQKYEIKNHTDAILESTSSSVSTTVSAITVTDNILDENFYIEYRLPNHLTPIYYDLLISTNFHEDINANEYNGSIKITLNCVHETNKIILHARNLRIVTETIEVIKLDDIDERDNVTRVDYDFEREFLIIELNDNLKMDKNYSVFLNFIGYLRNDMAGFFRSSYINENGEKK